MKLSNDVRNLLIVDFATEKSLVDCAYNLRAELENAAADVSGLFSKIG